MFLQPEVTLGDHRLCSIQEWKRVVWKSKNIEMLYKRGKGWLGGQGYFLFSAILRREGVEEKGRG